jgi:hypothetical protein
LIRVFFLCTALCFFALNFSAELNDITVWKLALESSMNMNIHRSGRNDIRIRTSIDGEYSWISKLYSRILVSGNYSHSVS